MCKPLIKPYFIIAIFLYLIVHLGRFGWYNPVDWINSYLTDFLCMPIILTICLVSVRILKRIPHFCLTVSMISGMTLFYTVIFEYLLPKLNANYTADWLDVVMYFAGASLYMFIWKREEKDLMIGTSA